AMALARSVLHRFPAHTEARHMMGLALLSVNQAKRASAYLYAAVQTAEAPSAALWFDLARAFRDSAQGQHAIQALETCLRLDETLSEGWSLLAELADTAGIPDLAAEARHVTALLATAQTATAEEKGVIKLNLSSRLRNLRGTP